MNSKSALMYITTRNLTAVAGWQHVTSCTFLLLQVSVGNTETQYYFSHRQRDVLHMRRWDGWWWAVRQCSLHIMAQ